MTETNKEFMGQRIGQQTFVHGTSHGTCLKFHGRRPIKLKRAGSDMLSLLFLNRVKSLPAPALTPKTLKGTGGPGAGPGMRIYVDRS